MKVTVGTSGLVLHAGYIYDGLVVDDHRPIKVKVQWKQKSGRVREAWRYAHQTRFGVVFSPYRVFARREDGWTVQELERIIRHRQAGGVGLPESS